MNMCGFIITAFDIDDEKLCDEFKIEKYKNISRFFFFVVVVLFGFVSMAGN